MLQLFTLQEAINELEARVPMSWSDSMVFDAALRLNLELRAAPPRQTKVAIWKFVLGEGLVKKIGGLPWSLGILYSQNIAELWQTGETEVIHAANQRGIEDEYHWFEEPVVVTLHNVRIPVAALEAISRNQVVQQEVEPPSGWPWGQYQTELLGDLNAAAQRFWVNYDPEDATTAPTNSMVSEWLQKKRGLSRTMADAMASILRPDGLPTGPRR